VIPIPPTFIREQKAHILWLVHGLNSTVDATSAYWADYTDDTNK
jgi:hypothetical protein